MQAPVPPRLRGNRGVGSLLAVLGAAGLRRRSSPVSAACSSPSGSPRRAPRSPQFILSAEFLIPVPIFLVAFVLLVLVVEPRRLGRARLRQPAGRLWPSTSGPRARARCSSPCRAARCRRSALLLSQPFIIIAALVAREVSIWIGLAISARGRRVKVRNLELVDEWEQEHAETKAQYERAGTTT